MPGANRAETLWCIISPIYKPAPGGAAVYSRTLARQLAQAGDDVMIWTEQHPGQERREIVHTEPGRVEVRRLFPYRAGRERKDAGSYLAYAFANLSYLRLPGEIRSAAHGYRRARILIHASLLYHPSVIRMLLNKLKDTGVADTKLILDVRDYGLPNSRRSLLPRFDRIITSSQGVAEFLGHNATPILMPFERPLIPSDREVQQVLERHGLAGRRFILNPNGINDAKQYNVFREFLQLLPKSIFADELILVNVGRERDRMAVDDEADANGTSRYLGNLAHDELLSLMKAAMFTVIPSNREAISRAALEAMSVGGNVILPDLPEFRKDCSSHIITELTGCSLLGMVKKLEDAPMPQYNFTPHADFLPLYQAL